MLDTVIQDMNFAKVQTAITLLLATELINQKDLFITGGGTLDEYNSDIHFNVSDGIFYTTDASKYPLVNVWVGEGVAEVDDAGHAEMQTKMHFDLYAFRKDEEKDGEIIFGTAGADKRLNYLLSQVWHILEAQENFWKGAKEVVGSCVFEGFKKIPSDKTPKEIPVSMGRLTWRIDTDEIKDVLEGWNVDEFRAQLNVNNHELVEIIIDKT